MEQAVLSAVQENSFLKTILYIIIYVMMEMEQASMLKHGERLLKTAHLKTIFQTAGAEGEFILTAAIIQLRTANSGKVFHMVQVREFILTVEVQVIL